MGKQTIDELDAGTTPDGTEVLEAVQGSNSVYLTIKQILAATSGITTIAGVSTSSYLEVGSGATIAGGIHGLSGITIAGAVSLETGYAIANPEAGNLTTFGR